MGQRVRFAAAGFDAGDALLPDVSNSFSGNAGSRRISAASRRRRPRLASVVSMPAPALVASAGNVQLRLQPVDFILNLLPRFVPGAAHQQCRR